MGTITIKTNMFYLLQDDDICSEYTIHPASAHQGLTPSGGSYMVGSPPNSTIISPQKPGQETMAWEIFKFNLRKSKTGNLINSVRLIMFRSWLIWSLTLIIINLWFHNIINLIFFGNAQLEMIVPSNAHAWYSRSQSDDYNMQPAANRHGHGKAIMCVSFCITSCWTHEHRDFLMPTSNFISVESWARIPTLFSNRLQWCSPIFVTHPHPPPKKISPKAQFAMVDVGDKIIWGTINIHSPW